VAAMMTIKHLLFIPCERLEGLLDADDLGAIAPCVTEHTHKDASKCWDPFCGRARLMPGFPSGRVSRRALALIWNGIPQPMGIWPLVASMPENASGSHLFGVRETLMVSTYTVEEAAEIARLCEELHDMGRVVIVEIDEPAESS